MVQAQRTEEANGFASCLLWGSVTSRAEDSSAGGGAFPPHSLFRLNAAALSFSGEGTPQRPANTPPVLGYTYTNHVFLKQLFQKNRCFSSMVQ